VKIPHVQRLKVWPHFFEQIRLGRKPWEIRRDDREVPFEEDQALLLEEWNPDTWKYSGRRMVLRVGLVLRGAAFRQFGLAEGHCIFTLTPATGLHRDAVELDLKRKV
jgi:hypothetical protein